VGSLGETQYPSHIFTWQVSPLRHTKVGVSPLSTRFGAHTTVAAAASGEAGILTKSSGEALQNYFGQLGLNMI